MHWDRRARRRRRKSTVQRQFFPDRAAIEGGFELKGGCRPRWYGQPPEKGTVRLDTHSVAVYPQMGASAPHAAPGCHGLRQNQRGRAWVADGELERPVAQRDRRRGAVTADYGDCGDEKSNVTGSHHGEFTTLVPGPQVPPLLAEARRGRGHAHPTLRRRSRAHMVAIPPDDRRA